nr:F-box/kelch-repeat protein At3g23880-like [Ipomoea batatas]
MVILGGLCYVSSTRDYKAVILIRPLIGPGHEFGYPFVISASLSHKEWRPVQFPYNLNSANGNVEFRNTFYWWASDIKDWDCERDFISGGDRNKILYFDPVTASQALNSKYASCSSASYSHDMEASASLSNIPNEIISAYTFAVADEGCDPGANAYVNSGVFKGLDLPFGEAAYPLIRASDKCPVFDESAPPYLRRTRFILGGLCYDSALADYKAVLSIHPEAIQIHKVVLSIHPEALQITRSSYHSPLIGQLGDPFVISASLNHKEWRPMQFPYNLNSARGGVEFCNTFY